MASIFLQMNNLQVNLSGVGGYIDEGTYTNTDPVTYVFKSVHKYTGETALMYLLANTETPTPVPGMRRRKTDEMEFSFIGAIPPNS